MRKFEKVECTKPLVLLFMLMSTLGVLGVTLFILIKEIGGGLDKVLIALVVSAIYYFLFKKNFSVSKIDFNLSKDRLEWEDNVVAFKDLKYYKIHWMKGAGIKFKFKNGKVLRISSNNNFCNAENFVDLCVKIDKNLKTNYKEEVTKKKTFFETKYGYYFAVTLTIFVVVILIVGLFNGREFDLGKIGVITVSLATVWSGVRWKRDPKN
ncbi:hypothetical protein [uncultured Tenacibaculum sp.]|uniref:hypothetical protein n=1 Tax=uncultured Tenacibaculum sp. TaxID=174713 RepID=UPI0026356F8B|nr:hypothetical protein [uncultured Tenacibaculum sp.]